MEKPFYLLVLFGGILTVISYPMNNEEDNRGCHSSQGIETTYAEECNKNDMKRSTVEKESKKSQTMESHHDALGLMVNPKDSTYGFDFFNGYEGSYLSPSNVYSPPSYHENEHKIVTRSNLPIPSYYDFMKNKPFSNVMVNNNAPEAVLSKRTPYVDQQQLMNMQYQRMLGMQHQQQIDMQRRQQNYMKSLQQLEHDRTHIHPAPMVLPHPRPVYSPQQRMLNPSQMAQLNMPLQNPLPYSLPPQQPFMPQSSPYRQADASKRFPPLSPELNNFLHTPLKDLLRVEQMAKVNHESFPPSLIGLFQLMNKDKPLTGHRIE